MERKEPLTPERRQKRKSGKVPTGKTGPQEEARLEINPALATLFREFSDRSLEFSREVTERSGVRVTSHADHARLNIRIARTVFGKWSVEILTFLYTASVARFQEIRKALGDISARVLSLKLARLEGLVRPSRRARHAAARGRVLFDGEGTRGRKTRRAGVLVSAPDGRFAAGAPTLATRSHWINQVSAGTTDRPLPST